MHEKNLLFLRADIGTFVMSIKVWFCSDSRIKYMWCQRTKAHTIHNRRGDSLGYPYSLILEELRFMSSEEWISPCFTGICLVFFLDTKVRFFQCTLNFESLIVCLVSIPCWNGLYIQNFLILWLCVWHLKILQKYCWTI